MEQLLAMMQRESEAVGRLLALLRAEEQALAERKVDEIERITGEKQALLGDLESFGQARERLLSAAGLSADREGFEALLARADTGIKSELDSAWSALRDDLAACQEQNLKNGQVLEANRRLANDVLSILLGNRENTELYGRDGTTTQGRGNHTYAKA